MTRRRRRNDYDPTLDFPNLDAEGWERTSEPTPTYNCIAWAVGESQRWWWPERGSYWPDGFPRRADFPTFRGVLAQRGFTPCDSDQPEEGFEKIALYGVPAGDVTHAARQLPNGQWTSKLGRAQDVQHTLRGLEDGSYGSVLLILRRPSQQPEDRD